MSRWRLHDQTLVFTTDTFRLTLDLAPICLRVWRGERLLLENAPRFEDSPPAITGWREADSELFVVFAAGDLSLRLAPAPDGCRVVWQSDPPALITDSFRLEPAGPWFGQGEFMRQAWPLDGARFTASPLETGDSPPSGVLNVQTPLWLAAGGVTILGEREATLDVEWGDGRLTLHAPHGRLAYDLFIAATAGVPEAFRAFIRRVGHPATAPPARLFEHPIWTTWTRHKTAIDQAATLAFARDIAAHDFPYSVLEIDDRWQSAYGDLTFDPNKFPDPAGLVAALHHLGFAVTLWVMPFIASHAARFAEARTRGFLVRGPDSEPAIVRWWQGQAALLDVSHPEALAWFADGLSELQDRFGVDGFKFDAGEASFFPRRGLSHGGIDGNEYTRRYVEFVAARFPFSEVRTAWFNQTAPVLVRLFDKDSRWDVRNGLRSVIPAALTFSLTGYPFVLPDIIGGNQYLLDRANAELLIRWTQASALLPAMQFSLAPWEYGPQAEAICRDYARLHGEFAPTILALAAEAARGGEPIIRPVFWADPSDAAAYRVDDEFLLGDRHLAAPVLAHGRRSRDVYLPSGTWTDHWSGASFNGPTTLAAYPAPLEHLPLFERRADG